MADTTVAQTPNLALALGQQPAFPCDGTTQSGGITIRDWFASQALVGLLSYSQVNPTFGNYHENCTAEQAARAAFAYADAMLQERLR